MRRGASVPTLLKVILVLAIVIVAGDVKAGGMQAAMQQSEQIVYLAVGSVIALIVLNYKGGRVRF